MKTFSWLNLKLSGNTLQERLNSSIAYRYEVESDLLFYALKTGAITKKLALEIFLMASLGKTEREPHFPAILCCSIFTELAKLFQVFKSSRQIYSPVFHMFPVHNGSNYELSIIRDDLLLEQFVSNYREPKIWLRQVNEEIYKDHLIRSLASSKQEKLAYSKLIVRSGTEEEILLAMENVCQASVFETKLDQKGDEHDRN